MFVSSFHNHVFNLWPSDLFQASHILSFSLKQQLNENCCQIIPRVTGQYNKWDTDEEEMKQVVFINPVTTSIQVSKTYLNYKKNLQQGDVHNSLYNYWPPVNMVTNMSDNLSTNIKSNMSAKRSLTYWYNNKSNNISTNIATNLSVNMATKILKNISAKIWLKFQVIYQLKFQLTYW